MNMRVVATIEEGPPAPPGPIEPSARWLYKIQAFLSEDIWWTNVSHFLRKGQNQYVVDLGRSEWPSQGQGSRPQVKVKNSKFQYILSVNMKKIWK